MRELPDRFIFTLGGFFSKTHQFVWQHGQINYHFQSLPTNTEPAIITPDSQAWARFWPAVAAAGVWQWEADYLNQAVLDGTQWSLELAFQGRYLSCEGSNAYPGGHGTEYSNTSEFVRFLKALETLTGIPDIR